MILQFKINNEKIDVTVIKKDIKNIYIKLSSNNEIIVSAPNNASSKFTNNFIYDNIEKFIKVQKLNFKKRCINLEEQTFYLFGILESYEIIDKYSSKNEWFQYLIFRTKKYKINKKTVTDIIYSIYKKELLLYLNFYQPEIEKIMSVEHHEIGVRIKQTSWASNYVKKKIIHYNTKLASYSPEIINYVIIHELSHAEYSNHSVDFWEKVKFFDPYFKDKKKKLKSFIYF